MQPAVNMIDGDIVTALPDTTESCISQRRIAEQICSVTIEMAGLLKVPCHRHKLSDGPEKVTVGFNCLPRTDVSLFWTVSPCFRVIVLSMVNKSSSCT
jgi:hypothetical protein